MGRGAAGRRGYFATAWIFDARLATQRLVADLELSWGFGTINVAAMSVGLFLLLLALIVELGLLGGHDAPREAGLWLWCVGVYLVGAANYTRTSPSEPVRTGETPNA